MLHHKNRHKQSFTLIELLIVIAIIAILAGTIIASTGSARVQARDVRRTQDLDALATALEFYYDDNKKYPAGAIGPSGLSSDAGFCIEQATATNQFQNLLIAGEYVSSVPKDPLYNASQCSSPYSSDCHCYIYKTDGDQKFKIFAQVEQQDFEPAKKDGGTRNIAQALSYEVYSVNTGSNQIAWTTGELPGGEGGIWIYNRNIAINNTSGSTLKDYQVQVTVNYLSGMQPDFDDIRFSDKYGSSLPYWLKEKTNNSSATYFVKVNTISPSSDTILVWYGNSSATYAGSYDNTFDKTMKLAATGSTDTSLKGEWLMDQGTGITVADTSGNNNTGTSYAKVLSFDGIDDYVDCGNGASLNITNAITIEAWIKPAGPSSAGAELVAKTEDFKGYSLYLGPQGNIIQLLLGIGSGTWKFGPSYNWPNGYNVWYHIVGRWDGTDMRLFANGVDIGNPTPLTGSILTTSNTLKIGKHYSKSSFFNGSIDEVRIYNRALTATEVANRYNGIEVSDRATSLKGEWRFSDVTTGSTTTQDYSGNNNTGTLVNGPTVTSTWQQPSNTAPWDSKSTYFTNNSSSLKFNGIDDYVSTNYLQNSITKYTIEAWVKIPSTGSNNVIVQNRGYGEGKSLTLGIGHNMAGRLYFVGDSNGVIIGPYYDGGLNDNNWHHIVGVFDAPSGSSIVPSQFTLYLDGQQKSPTGNYQIGSMTSPLTGLGGTQIGYHQAWNTYFNGLIDEVRIYNRALTQNEIKAHYEHRKCAKSDATNCGVTAAVQ